ncbi:tyrosine-type recombinase/integrase [Nocardia elegans]|uniref:Tyrosine-type recombinase/integrase n=1 Tax=Nocardia elegans TaxID=300029 RepID=A0ABW6TMJ1_9NOCA
MSHVQDQWFKEVPDPDKPGKTKKVKTAAWGKGMRYKVRWIDDGGAERSKSFPDKKKSEADAYKTFIDNSLLERAYVDPQIGKTPFKTVAYDWLKGTSPDPSSRDTTRRQMDKHIIPFFEKSSIARAGTVPAVRDWLEWVNKRGLDPFYVTLLFNQLSSILAMAHREKYIPDNPCKSSSITKPKAARKVIVPWQKAKVDAIHDALPARNKIVIPLGAGLGMRQGEILALDLAEDFDRTEQTVHIQRQIRRLNNGVLVFSLPKHDKTRVAPVGKYVADQLDAYADEFPPVPITLPWKFADGPAVTVNVLMTRDDAKVWYGELFNATVWAGAFRDAGIPRRRRIDGMHQLRHFYASTQLANLVSIRELAEYLGHADASLTLNTYGHLMPDSHSRSRAAVDTVWGVMSDPGTAYGRPGDLDGVGGGDLGEGSGVVDLDEI